MLDFFSTENLIHLIRAVGYLGIFAIVFAESGLFIGFMLPGDSLLFVAGFLAHQGHLNLPLLLLIVFIAAVLGDNFGYTFGKKIGVKIFTREESLLFKKENLANAQEFYRKHGAKTLVLARFIPVIRTFAPILAGVGEMQYKKFFFYNVSGGLFWTLLIVLSGYFLGEVIPDIDRYILPIILGIIAVSILPSMGFVFTDRIKKKIKKKKQVSKEKDTEV